MKPKRIVIIADLHTGSEVGLRTHPQNRTQQQLLARYHDCIRAFGPAPDLLIVNGDANDGQDRKSLAVQDNDVPWQIEEAEALVRMWEPKAVYLTEGTAYHTGDTVQYERFLAGYLSRRGIACEFHTKLRLEVNGWFKLQARHKIGRSIVPYGAHTSPARSQTHQVINAAEEARTNREPVRWPHLSVFSHVHYWSFGETAMGAYMTTPCWKAVGDRFGDTQCDGHIDLGAAQLVIGATEREGWSWSKRLYAARLESRTVKL